MVSWLKFYFLGFIFDKYGKQATTRSFLNVVLSLLLSLVLLCAGITVGYSASFDKHYTNAEEFRNFLYATFVEDVSSISLTFEDGKLNAVMDGDNVNTFKNADDGVDFGYRLVVDTRPAETTFDNFTLICKDANGTEVSYEDFRNLSEQGKQNGSVTFVYTGNTLDVVANQAEYTAYLDKLSNVASSEYDVEVASAYSELKHKKSVNEISSEEYSNEIYVLYAKSYYPDYSKVEIYGNAPTLRTYYMQAQLTDGVDKYLILLDDLCICSFASSNGVRVDFGSYYNGIDSGVITANGLSDSEMRANVDSFITKCFTGSSGFNFLVNFMNIGKFVLLLIVVMLVLSLVIFIICKVLRLEFGSRYFGIVKMTGNYLLYGAVITFIVETILSFMFSRNTVFLVSEIVFVGILVLRTVALLIAEIVRKSRNKVEQKASDQDGDLV